MRRLLLAAGSVLLASAGAVSGAAAQPAAAPASAVAVKPVDAAERTQVVTELAKTLEANFVFPEVGAKYAAMLRANLAKGAYDGLTAPSVFGEKVTADLQAVAKDGHLRLATQEVFNQRRPAPATVPL